MMPLVAMSIQVGRKSPTTTTMRAYVVNECVHPSELGLVPDAPEPTPKPDEVIVDVYSAALNFFDVSKFYWSRTFPWNAFFRFFNPKANISSSHLSLSR